MTKVTQLKLRRDAHVPTAVRPLPASVTGLPAGVTITFNFNQCEGPIFVEEGVEQAIREAFLNSGAKVMALHITPFSDGTVNATADLGESHSGLGTYRLTRFVRGDVTMCFEARDNTILANRVVNNLQAKFKPKHIKRTMSYWQAE